VLGKALSDAEKDGAVLKNICKVQKVPKVAETEMVISQDVPSLVAKLQGTVCTFRVFWRCSPACAWAKFWR
jgi:hypothetical protein